MSVERVQKGFWAKLKENPWVPLGSMFTAGVLASGLFAFYKGKQSMSQNMMRLRVIAQGATVAILVIGSWQSGIDFTAKQQSRLLESDLPAQKN